MIEKLKILFGKDCFRKNDLLYSLGLSGLVNQKIESKPRLKRGEEVIIKLPKKFTEDGFSTKKVNYKIGDVVDFGDVIAVFENDKLVFEFESFTHGRLTYVINDKKSKIETDTIIAKIKAL